MPHTLKLLLLVLLLLVVVRAKGARLEAAVAAR
jgi:hypothetical protein